MKIDNVAAGEELRERYRENLAVRGETWDRQQVHMETDWQGCSNSLVSKPRNRANLSPVWKHFTR